jgi:CHAT domain-containing protein/tetratricopeptide (TPR) repeat protein
MKAIAAATVALLAASPFIRGDQEAPAAMLLEPGKPVARSLARGEVHRYRIDASAGAYLRVTVASRGIGVAATLSRPDGAALTGVDVVPGRPEAEALVAIAVVAGAYALNVRPLEKDPAPGEYQLVVEDARPARAEEQPFVEAEGLFADAQRAQQEGTAASLAVAVDRHRKAQAIWRRAGAYRREAGAGLELAAIHEALSQNQEALEDVRQLLAVADRLASGRLRGRALNTRGSVEYSLGEPTAAASLREALGIWARLDDAEAESDTLNSLAIIHRDRGEEQKALEHYLKALALTHATGDKAREAMSLHNVGVFYGDLNEPQRAREYFEQALALVRAAKDTSGQGATLLELGLVYSDLGETKKAIDTALEAVRVTHDSGNRRWEVRALVRAGRVYDAAGARDSADEYLRRALDLSRAIPDRQGECDVLRAIGRRELAAGRAQAALEALRQALSITQSLGDQSRTMRVLNQVAGAERATGNDAAALQHSEAALALTESLRGSLPNHQLRGSMLAWAQAMYDFHIDLLMQMHHREPSPARVAAALEASERSRARSFLELVSEAGTGPGPAADPALGERDRDLEKRLSGAAERQMRALAGPHTAAQAEAISAEIRDVTREHDLVEAQMRAARPRSAAFQQAQPLTLAEIQQQVLDDRTILLEYHFGAERSHLWAVSRESVKVYDLPKASEIETIARRWHDLLSAGPAAGGEDEARTQAAALSAMLIAPAADQLRDRRLLIVADGALQYIPFAALPSPGKADTPLVVDHEVVSVPSASFVAVLRRHLAGRAPAKKTLAVLADPVFDSGDERVASGGGKVAAAVLAATDPPAHDLTRAARDVGLRGGAISRLPFTRREAKAILSLVPAGQRMEALDFAASQETASSPELAQYRYVHFATHGFADSAHPELSGIVLSLVDREGRERSGFLPASQVFNLKIPADLVVLSGCRTALGKEIRGEGLLGLTRAFMSAGAARVVASLWKVDDAATAELMKSMYERILHDGERPAQALRSAQVAMWRDRRWSAPYFWAAFVIQGEWN